MPLEVKEVAVAWAQTYSIRTNNLNLTVEEAAATQALEVVEGVTSACLRSQLIIQSTLQIIQ
jgi:hypothetical protein